VRFDLYWSAIEPHAKGVYDQAYLTKLDGVLAAARARGIRPTISVLGTPAWARHNAGSSMTPPDHSADFGDIMGFLAGRYASQPDLAWEIWNEPNQQQFWDIAGGPNPAAYGRLLKAAYPRIKAVAPNATVLGGSIAFNDQTYLRRLYIEGGAKGSFDALAVHPYSLAHPPTSTASAYKPLWITEVGWSSHQVSDSTRAGYFEQAVSMLADYPQVAVFQVYALNAAEDLPDMALTSASGQASGSWTAYTAAARAAR
jgi:hypothetical protein